MGNPYKNLKFSLNAVLRIKHLLGEPEKYRRMQYAIVIKYSLDFFGNISIGNYEIDSYLTEY